MKKISYLCFICLFVLLTTVAILFVTNTRVPLGILCKPVSKFFSLVTDSEVEISGSYYISLGKWLVVTVNNGSIVTADKDGLKISAEIEQFETTIHLTSFLKKRLLLDGVTLQGVKSDFNLREYPRPKTGEESSHFPRLPFVLQSTGEITLKDIETRIYYGENKVPVQYHLDKGTGKFGTETSGRLDISGTANAITLKANIASGPLRKLFAEKVPWPFSVQLAHKSIVASVNGYVQLKSEKPEIAASFRLEGKKLDDLVSLFGRNGSKNKDFSLKGNVELTEQDAKVQLSVTAPGTKNLVFTGLLKKGEMQDTHYRLKVQSESIDLDEIKGFITSPQHRKKSLKNTPIISQIGRDDIILPEKFPVNNLDLDLDLKRLAVAGKSIKDLTLKAIVDDGYIIEAPFSATFKTSSLTGLFTFQKEDTLPHIKLRLDSRSFNIGAFLKEFKFAESIDMQIAEMSTDLSSKGRTPGELFDNLEFTTTSKDGIYVFEDINTGASLPIHLHHSTIRMTPGNGLDLHLIGEMRDSPVDIAVQFEDLRVKSATDIGDVSFSSVITLAGGRLELDGKVPLPLKQKGTTLNSRLSCEKLSDFNNLLGLELPEVGPLSMAGTLHVVPKGYSLQSFNIIVASSSMTGDASIDTTAEVPQLTVNIQANTIQLADFKYEQKQRGNVSQISEQQTNNQNPVESKKKKRRLTDQKILDKYNAHIDLKVRDVFSGMEHLGSGNLTIEQQSGTFKVAPLQLNLPRGTATLSFSIEPDDETRRYMMNMEVSDLDYGTIGRWFKPDTDLKGVIHLRSSLTSKSTDFKSIMAGASGYLDFSIHPDQFRSGVIDLWAVNFFLYLVPYLTPKNESIINCAAARFSIENGVLRDEDLLIDTSRIQVKGKVEVDFTKQWIDSIFKPKPKRPQFLSLATPVKVSGNLSKFKAKVPLGAVIGTVLRNAASYVTVPVQWLFKKNPPKDGTANCIQLFESRTFNTNTSL